MQQLPDIHPPRDGENEAKRLCLLKIHAGLLMPCFDPPEREPYPQKGDEQAEALRPRQGAACATTHGGEQEIAHWEQGEHRALLADQER